jgi:hypothetical protein
VANSRCVRPRSARIAASRRPKPSPVIFIGSASCYGLNSEKNQYAPNQTAKITRAITQDGYGHA